jgi:hypothetical protein
VPILRFCRLKASSSLGFVVICIARSSTVLPNGIFFDGNGVIAENLEQRKIVKYNQLAANLAFFITSST